MPMPRHSKRGPAQSPAATSKTVTTTDTTKVPRNGPTRNILTPEQTRILHNWISEANGVAPERLAYVAVVCIADGKYRRRPYLTLAAALRAVERAEARGVDASVYLAELTSVPSETS